MKVAFITSREEKFLEMEAMLAPEIYLEQFHMILDELQGLVAERVLQDKIHRASKHVSDGGFIVDDTWVSFACLGGRLPGPYIKDFFGELGADGLFKLVRDLGRGNRATATTRIGYGEWEIAKRLGPMLHTRIFTGEMHGRIVEPRGDSNYFDWNTIFQPDGHSKTFGEMSDKEKNQISMRRIAADKLKTFLLNKE